MVHVLASFLYGAYIWRQSFWGAEHQGPLLALMAAASLALVAGTERLEIEFLGKHRDQAMLALASILLVGVMFSDWSSLLAVLAKAVIVVFLALHASKDPRVLISMADTGVLAVLLIGSLAYWGLIPSQFSQTSVWTKNYFGFINPNIGPYFLFSSAFVFYFYGRMVRFSLVVSILALLWFQFQVFSRTFIAGSAMLLAYVLVVRSRFLEAALSRALAILLGLATVMYLILAILLIGNAVSAKGGWLQVVDYFFSQRLWFLSEVSMRVTNAGSLIRLKPFDSIYYEVVFLLGPYFIFALWRLFYCRLSGGVHLGAARVYGLYVFLTVGLFEGLFSKFSPMIVAVSAAMASILAASHRGFSWRGVSGGQTRGATVLAAVLALSGATALALYLVPAYRMSAAIVSAIPDAAPDLDQRFRTILDNVGDCSRLHARIERKEWQGSSGAAHGIVVDVNDLSVGQRCLEGFSKLVGSSFLRRVDLQGQNSEGGQHYFVEDVWLLTSKIEMLKKKNLLRYFFFAALLSILMIGFYRFQSGFPAQRGA